MDIHASSLGWLICIDVQFVDKNIRGEHGRSVDLQLLSAIVQAPPARMGCALTD